MIILIKILVSLMAVLFLVRGLVVVDRRLANLSDLRLQLLGKSSLYAFVFTPTVYHHEPNTIVAPFHLSTICGSLFYQYDYTVEMFIFGVVAPLVCGWALIAMWLLFRTKHLGHVADRA